MTIDEIEKVLFVGAGQMGCANSLVAAVSGYDVVLHDANPDALDAVAPVHEAMGAYLVQTGYCTDDDLTAARGRVALETDLERAVAGADLVSESIIEDLDIKRAVFANLDRLVPVATILTTNTSALLVSDIEDAVEHGDRFAALHSHLGALLFDIVGGPRTSPRNVDVLRRYVESLGGVPLVLEREHPGYVFNALNGAVLATALKLVVDGEASLEDVDRAWMVDRSAPMGPFGMIDLFGIDLVITAWRKPADDPIREAMRPRVEAYLADYVAAGQLGQKSGHGFYDYPDPTYQAAGFLTDAPLQRRAADALTTALLARAASIAALGVAPPATIDLAWTTATGQPSGPFAILDQLPTDRLREMLDAQVALGLITNADGDAMVAFTGR